MFHLGRRTQQTIAFEEEVVNSKDARRYVSGQGMVRRKKHQSSQYESTGHCGPNAFQINMKNANFPFTVAKGWCSIEVVPEHEAFIRRAGLGRTAPNKLNVGVIRRYVMCLNRVLYSVVSPSVLFVGRTTDIGIAVPAVARISGTTTDGLAWRWSA
jgi:hypothetical protein